MEQQMKDAVKTQGTGILWTSLVFYVLVAFCGLLNLVLPKAMAAPAAPVEQPAEPPSQPAPPSQPPAGQ